LAYMYHIRCGTASVLHTGRGLRRKPSCRRC
jgi:hypothetical protein